MKKRIISILLALVMVLGMLPALASVADAAANSWARWNDFVLEWVAVDHFSYRVDIYMKDPTTNENIQLSTGCFSTIGRTNCETIIADALIKYGLESAEFGYGRGMRHSSNPDKVSEYNPTGFARFYLSDFITMSENTIWEYYLDVLYVGQDYTYYPSLQVAEDGWARFEKAGYTVEIHYDANIAGTEYAAVGNLDNVPELKIYVTEDMAGQEVSFTYTMLVRNPDNKIVLKQQQTVERTIDYLVVDELKISIDSPHAGYAPSYEASVSGDSATMLFEDIGVSAVENGIRWYDLTDARFLDPSKEEGFCAGHQYQVWIYLKTIPYVTFKMDGYNYAFESYGVNNSTKNVALNSVSGYDGKTVMCVRKTFEKLPAATVESIAHSAPRLRAGDPFPYPEDLSMLKLYQHFDITAPFCKNGYRWYDKTTEEYIDPNSDALVQSGHEYILVAYFQTICGATFYHENGAPKLDCAGSHGRVPLEAIPGYDSQNYLMCRVDYSAEDVSNLVYYVNLKINEPIVGLRPDYEAELKYKHQRYGLLREDSEYSLNGVRWYDETAKKWLDPESDVFVSGHDYTVHIALQTLSDCVFYLNDSGEYSIYASLVGIDETLEVEQYKNLSRETACVVSYTFRSVTEAPSCSINTNVPIPGFDATNYAPILIDRPSYIKVMARSWRTEDGVEFTGTFKKGETYIARFVLNITGFTDGLILAANGQQVDYLFHPVDRVVILNIPMVCQGPNALNVEMLYTDDSSPRANHSVTVDIEAMSEQSEILMEAYFDGQIAYQWYCGGRAIEGATTDTLSFTEEDVGRHYYVSIVVGDGTYGITGDAFEIKPDYTDSSIAISSIAATIAVPKVGSPLPSTATVTADAASGIVLTQVQCFASNTGSNNRAEWSEHAAGYIAEEGEYYSALITVYAADDHYFTEATTGTVNGKAHDARWEAVYVSTDKAVLRIVWSPCDISGHTEDGHECSVCGEVLSGCIDANKDYKCDICGAEMKKDEVVRLAGANRWATSLMVADEMKANLGIEKFGAIIVASGNDFADALAGSYLSTVKNAPILLGWGKGGKYVTLDEANIAYIKNNLASGGTVYILGGKNAVPELYETSLSGYNVKRLGGANRFETNLLILEEAGVADGSEILVCTSTNFADSLSASATAKPILLVFNEYGKLYGKQPEFLAGLKNCTFTVIGGESAVSAKLADAIKAYGAVTRLAGANRFETSVLVAQKYFDEPTTAVLAYAWNYPDGLCGGSLAYSLKAPLILTMTKYEAKAVEYAKAAGITSGIVLGGDSLISDEAVRAIFAMEAGSEILLKK